MLVEATRRAFASAGCDVTVASGSASASGEAEAMGVAVVFARRPIERPTPGHGRRDDDRRAGAPAPRPAAARDHRRSLDGRARWRRPSCSSGPSTRSTPIPGRSGAVDRDGRPPRAHARDGRRARRTRRSDEPRRRGAARRRRTEARRPARTRPSVDRTLLRSPSHRFARPAEVASAIRFVAGPDAAFMTGQTLRVDGGWASLNQAPEGMRFP